MIVENEHTNRFFLISIAVILGGILMYLIQEMVVSMQQFAYPAFVVIADFLGIFAIIGLIVWLFWSEQQTLIMNIVILLSLGYVLIFFFGHFFAPRYDGNTGPNMFENFADTDLDFISLFILFLLTIGLIVIFAMKFAKRTEFAIYEKFTIILWLIAIGIFSSLYLYFIRFREVFDNRVGVGIVFLPRITELIYAFFGAVLLILYFFAGVKKKILNLLTLLMINMIALTLLIGTVGDIGCAPSRARYTPMIMGNVFIIIGTVALAVCTFFVLRIKYPKSVAKQ
ncbi:MAG: hypothetical protein FK733_04855 [Asgard group archaeon]|nr:hypothetical protein [Asgard group archaeon]